MPPRNGSSLSYRRPRAAADLEVVGRHVKRCAAFRAPCPGGVDGRVGVEPEELGPHRRERQPGEGGAVHRRVVDAEAAPGDAHVGVQLVSGDGGQLRVGAEGLRGGIRGTGAGTAPAKRTVKRRARRGRRLRRGGTRAVMDPPGAASRGAWRGSTDRGFRSLRVVHDPTGRPRAEAAAAPGLVVMKSSRGSGLRLRGHGGIVMVSSANGVILFTWRESGSSAGSSDSGMALRLCSSPLIRRRR